jgi:hypothetical protein
MSTKDKRRHIVVYERDAKNVLLATSVPIVRDFRVYYSGWDCDSIGYVVEHGKRNRIVLTSHGTAYFAPTSALSEMARELEAAVAIMHEAILDCTG